MDRVWDVAMEGLIPMALFVVLLASVLVVIRLRAGAALPSALFVSAVDALLAGWAVGLSLVTLGDWFGEGRQLDLVPLHSIGAYVSQWDETTVPATQILGNVLLFLPFGLLAPARWPTLRRLLPTVGVAALIAVPIEILQFASAQGRVTSTDDVLLAIVGAAVGWLIYRVLDAGVGALTTARTPSPASPGSPRS